MKDKIDQAKEASRKLMLAQAEQEKLAFIREIKKGLGQKMIQELENIKPLSRRKKIWNKIKKVLGI